MLKLSSKHQLIRAYYQELNDFEQLNQHHEGTVKIAFQHVLEGCAKQCQWVLVQQQTLKQAESVDGVLFDKNHLVRGYWEAKDGDDELSIEVQKKCYQGNRKTTRIIF